MTASEFVRVGDRLPDMTFPDLDGTPHPLLDREGRRSLIFMWASW